MRSLPEEKPSFIKRMDVDVQSFDLRQSTEYLVRLGEQGTVDVAHSQDSKSSQTSSTCGFAASRMSIDVLITGVTGFVGRFVLLQIVETQPETRIAVLIRPSGKKSAAERFRDEVIGSTLFSAHEHILSKVFVVAAALEDVEKTSLLLHSAKRVIHCAANVKHYDPYESLERDNVHNVGVMIKLAEKLKCETLTLLSTCYVHPRSIQTGAIQRIPPNTRREEFYNDYSYTKWRGEESVFSSNSTITNIHILRLSCVGSPVRSDLLAHPFSAQAHLGILSFVSRGYIQVLASRQNGRISVIPVDVAAKAIVELSNTEAENGIQLHQLCPPPQLDAFHLSLPVLFSVVREDSRLSNFRGIIQEETYGCHLPWWYRVASWFHGRTRKALELHEKVQDFVSTFSDGDIRFESSLDESEFPDLSEREVVSQSLAYSIRILHNHQLEKSIPLPVSDRFWHRLGNKEPVTLCFSLKTPIPAEEWSTYQTKFWSVFMSHRKCTAVLEDGILRNGPARFADFFGEIRESVKGSENLLALGLSQPPPSRFWKIQPVISESEEISNILLQVDHGLVDGVGGIDILHGISQTVFTPSPVTKQDPPTRRPLSFWSDLWLGFVYLILVGLSLFSPDTKQDATRTATPNISVTSVGVQKHDRFTFTSHLIWKLMHALQDQTSKKSHIFAIPVAFRGSRAPSEMLKNDFVSVLLPISTDMSESAFEFRCGMLRSKSVAFFSWCLQQLIERGQWDWLRHRLTRNVSAVVSSLKSDRAVSEDIDAIHVVTTTPAPIPVCVTAFTVNDKTHITVRSHSSTISSSKLIAAMQDQTP